MANDEEYVQQQIDRVGNTAELSGGKPTPPPLTEWSQLAELMTRQIQETEALKIIFIAANSKKGSQKPPARPVPRPVGIIVELLKRKRYENHFALRARLLPSKYGTPAQKASAEPPPKEDARWDSKASLFGRRRR